MLITPKRLKNTDFRFDTRVSRFSPEMISHNLWKRGRGHLAEIMPSHELHLLWEQFVQECNFVTVTYLLVVERGHFVIYCMLFLADRTNSRAYATVLRPASVVVCDVMYCG